MPKVTTSPAALSVPEIIEQLGGGVTVATALRINPSAISNWKMRGAVPPGRARELVALALRLGKTRITLASILDAAAGDGADAAS